MNIRKAAVAGQFYDADPARLKEQIATLLKSVDGPAPGGVRGLIVPHAGYIYSGRTAAAAYRCLELAKKNIDRVVLFGPAHRVYLDGMAVPSSDAFATPLGKVRLDRSAIDRIAALPGVSIADEAHREEHSLEVQLPFLQEVLDDFTLVPVVVGRCPPQTIAAVMDTLWQTPGTLLAVSTDLSHFHSYQEARKIDASTCARLLAREHAFAGEDACGAAALNGLMCTRQGRDLRVELLDNCNSGDTAGGKDRVVGYGAFILH
jgi:AmmeMemoRadiSam system protein B